MSPPFPPFSQAILRHWSVQNNRLLLIQKRENHTGLIVALNVIALLIIAAVCTAGIYSRYGGFGTGECADTEEFLKYADSISEIAVPNETQIVWNGICPLHTTAVRYL